MSLKISIVWAIGIVIFPIGVGLVFIPTTWIIGIIISSIGFVILVWALTVYMFNRSLRGLYPKRLQITYIDADFINIGATSPSIYFYLNIHNYSCFHFYLTGIHEGDLHNPASVFKDIWKGTWQVDTNYQDTIKPDADSKIRILWYVPPNYNSGPMAELAFRAIDKKFQWLTFDNMFLELETKLIKIKSTIGWLQLLTGTVEVGVPTHPKFDAVRKEYNRAEGDK